MISTQWNLVEVTDGGERVTHLYPNDCFYAHLSIYQFAAQYSQGKLVLDAGSGAGYGSAYLADHGATFVWGIDVSGRPVAFSQQEFSRYNLSYRRMDLETIAGFPPATFDVIFTSNTLEHVPNVEAFFRGAWRLLKPDGVLIVAVPPIINDWLREANLANLTHLNIWTPRQWQYALDQFFGEVQPYSHLPANPDLPIDFSNPPELAVVTEDDFAFAPVATEDFFTIASLTAIFVARKPRPEGDLPPAGSLAFVDDSFTRAPAAEYQGDIVSEPQNEVQLNAQREQIAQLEAQLGEQRQHIDQLRGWAQQLEGVIATKNAHIASLELLIARIEAGRVMRLFHRFSGKR